MPDDRDVVYVEREGGGALKWLLLGAAVGAGLALLFAPKSGREIRRDLGKGIKGLRELADETLEEFGRDAEPDRPKPERPSLVGAREELERRLAAARARRRQPVPDDEEPVA